VENPYRSSPARKETDDAQEASEVMGLVAFVVLLGALIAGFAPRNRSDDPEPRGHAAHHGGSQVHQGGRR
jgi:hypothetical protein